MAIDISSKNKLPNAREPWYPFQSNGIHYGVVMVNRAQTKQSSLVRIFYERYTKHDKAVCYLVATPDGDACAK